jgi:HK97 family phage portal protein
MSAAHLKLQGNFYALKSMVRDEVRELIPLQLGAVESVIQAPDYSLAYKIKRPSINGQTGITDTVPGNRIMHIRGLTLNGFMGLSPISYARESIGLALATEKHGAKLFSHGAMMGGVLTMPGSFKDRNVAQKFLDDFNDSYSSVANAHKTALLEQGVKWEKMAMTSVDSQFLEARNFQRQEIVQLMFNMPLGMMTTGDKVATFASSGNFAQDFVTYCLLPLAVSAEKEGRRSLLTAAEKKAKYYIKFEAGALLRGSFKEQMDAFATAINEEILNPNECRELLDRNPYKGGDEYRTRTSTVKQPATADQGGAKQ